MVCERKPKPSITWAAHYKPHTYCLAVVSYKNVLYYSDGGDRRFSDITSKDDEYYESIKSHTRDMICLHHMLVSSIKDHTYLERVVVTDLNYMGRLILEKDTLAELRNCTSTNLELVQARYRSGSLINFDVPLIKNHGFILDNACFCIVEWWEKTMGDHTDKDADWVIKSELLEGLCMRTLISILENPANVEDNDNRTVLQLLSGLECGGSLL